MSRAHPEDASQAELRSTEVGARTARCMTWAFVALLATVPVAQGAVEIAHRQSPQAFDVFRPVLAAARSVFLADRAGLRRTLATLVSRDFPKGFEAAVERASIFKRFVQPQVQRMVTGGLGFGNDQAVVGRTGWLFYQPGVNYVVGPDVTDAGYLAATTKKMIDKGGERDPHPDSRPAWLELSRDCAAAGIRLVLLPIPDKAMLQPEALTSRMSLAGGKAPANNRGYGRLVGDLEARGIDVFDPTPSIVRSGDVRYLIQDTHWTPEFMDAVSKALARHIDPAVAQSAHGDFELVSERVERVGDIVDMLNLPRDQRLFRPQPVTAQMVIDRRTGQPWQPDPASDVLLLGDSFTNIYSQPALGWGESAGLAEHLSYHLGRSVDVFALNGGGASAMRAELARRAASGTRAWPTKVIVYEVAMRFLMGESWPPVEIRFPRTEVELNGSAIPAPGAPRTIVPPPSGRAQTPARATPAKPAAAPMALPASPMTVLAEVLQTSKVPAPGTAPYKDCLVYVKLRIDRVESGVTSERDVIGAFWAMRNDAWLPAATYAVGDRLRLTLIPMDQADRRTQALQRADDLNDFILRVYFVTSEAKQ